ncbi:MAG: TonB-dependent receptor [Bacteroidales bacterium]|nr:TonB-dependent receptor [Bacteroidales bacterium]
MKRVLIIFLFSFILSFAGVWAQKTITGIIQDENDEPLIGATIVMKGTNQGTVSDVNGYYSIEVRDENDILVFSFLGYLAEEIPVGSKSSVNVNLIPDFTGMEEVVVIGYGTIKKRDLTAPVASVNAEQIKDMPLASTAQALTGRLAGVSVTTSEGSPDAEVKIRVRGGGSITQDNDPLYIVDGFPVDGISDISPNDIESIDVLKDASSTAIYGARGANGVIIVTTKSGTKDKIRVNYNFYTGLKQLPKKLAVLSPEEFVLYQYERSGSSVPERNQFEDIYGTWEQMDGLYSNVSGTDWQEEVFGRNARTTSHNLSIRGGAEKFSYNVSYTNNDDQGIMIESGYKRNNINLKLNVKATDRLSLDLSARYSDLKVMGSGTSDPGKASQNRLKHSVTYRPIEGFSDDPEFDFDDDEYYSVSGLTDPVELAMDEYRQKHTVTTNFNGALNYNLFEDLLFRSDIGYYTDEENEDRFYGLTTYLARRYADMPVVRVSNDDMDRIRWANTLNYTKSDLENGHDINLLLGQELLHTNTREYLQETREFPTALTPELALGMMSLGEDPQPADSYNSQDKLLSFFGRINYGYKDKYLLQASLRADGSSKFTKANRWGFFPSGSVAWRISEENFMDNIAFVSSLKLRLSYGHAGNNRIPDYYFLSRFETDPAKQYFLNESPTAYLYRPEPYNPDLKWETTITRDIGLDLGIFNERLQIILDYYYNSTKDLLVEVPLDPSTGYESQIQNIGSTTNYGFETAVNAYVIDKGDFKLSVNFNIALNRNRVDKLGEGVEIGYVPSEWSDDTGYDYIVRVGDPIGLMYGFETDGFYTVDDFEIDPETGEFLYDENGDYLLKPGIADSRNVLFEGFGPGSYKLRNLADPVDSLGNPVNDGNLVTFADDRKVIGNANPKHIGGLNIMAQYRGFDLSIFLNWVYGNDIYNANKIEFTSGYKAYTNLLENMNSDVRWMTVDENGDEVTDPEELAALNQDATMWKPPTGRYLFHSWAVEDGSFLRINNVTLGYSFPQKWLNKVFIQNFRIFFTINNLYTFTNYSGYDPEVDTRRDTPMTPGVDYSAYPRSRMYLIGLNLTL